MHIYPESTIIKTEIFKFNLHLSPSLATKEREGILHGAQLEGFFCESFLRKRLSKTSFRHGPSLFSDRFSKPVSARLFNPLDCWNTRQRRLISVIPKKNITDEACFHFEGDL